MQTQANTTKLASAAVIVTHAVADYETWKRAFDGDATARRNAGIVATHINRSAENPNLVSIYLAATDAAKLDAFLSSADLKETSSKLDAILAKVDSGPGTAAKLLNDPGVYNDVRGLLQRMDSLLADIKRNPKRYINVSVF